MEENPLIRERYTQFLTQQLFRGPQLDAAAALQVRCAGSPRGRRVSPSWLRIHSNCIHTTVLFS